MEKILKILVDAQGQFINILRITIAIVMIWIGGLKAFQYEADGIVPFVANSPVMSFFYTYSDSYAQNEQGQQVKQYNLHKNPEGKVVQKNIDWHQKNNTYLFSYALGSVIVGIGFIIALGIWSPKIGLLGAVLTFGMSIVTLSFLITTPETFVPNLGGDFPSPNVGFPYLSGAGRLVIKDIIMCGAALVIASDSAASILKKRAIK